MGKWKVYMVSWVLLILTSILITIYNETTFFILILRLTTAFTGWFLIGKGYSHFKGNK